MAQSHDHGVNDQNRSMEASDQRDPGWGQLSYGEATGKEDPKGPDRMFQENLSGIAKRVGAEQFHQEMKNHQDGLKEGGRGVGGLASQSHSLDEGPEQFDGGEKVELSQNISRGRLF